MKVSIAMTDSSLSTVVHSFWLTECIHTTECIDTLLICEDVNISLKVRSYQCLLDDVKRMFPNWFAHLNFACALNSHPLVRLYNGIKSVFYKTAVILLHIIWRTTLKPLYLF